MGWMAPVKRWIVCTTGFLQHEGDATGTEILQDAIHRLCSCADTRVLLKSWRDNPQDLARRIHHHTPDDSRPTVILVGYSYGGYTSVLIARELRKYGIDVEWLILCDPVWRPRFLINYWLSMLDVFSIRVPNNVHNLFITRQSFDYPRGAGIKLEDETRTSWIRPDHDIVYPEIPHRNIDKVSMEFKKKAMEEACPKAEALKTVAPHKLSDLKAE